MQCIEVITPYIKSYVQERMMDINNLAAVFVTHCLWDNLHITRKYDHIGLKGINCTHHCRHIDFFTCALYANYPKGNV
jgi:hypothetical protein